MRWLRLLPWESPRAKTGKVRRRALSRFRRAGEPGRPEDDDDDDARSDDERRSRYRRTKPELPVRCFVCHGSGEMRITEAPRSRSRTVRCTACRGIGWVTLE